MPVNVTRVAGQTFSDGHPADQPTGRILLWKARAFEPFPWQRDFLMDIKLQPGAGDPRYINANVGRGAGKTTVAAELAWEGATIKWTDGLGPPHVKIFADTYEHGRLIWDAVWDDSISHLRPLVLRWDADRNIIVLVDEDDPVRPGAMLQLLSADNPNAMTGHNKTTLAIIDEAQFVKDESWRQFLPSLNIRKGIAVCFGVCQGQGFYRTNSLKGLDPDFSDHKTYSVPSTANPYFLMSDDELARREYSLEEYRQLFLAQWTGAEGMLFENVDGCLLAPEVVLSLKNGVPLILEQPQPNADYVAGLDIAKSRDFMALIILNRQTGRLAAILRANKRTYTFLESLVADTLVMYHPRCRPDVTGMGEAPYEHIRQFVRNRYNEMDIPPTSQTTFHPETLTGTRKQEIIDDLALHLLRERVRFPNIRQLVSELRVFEKSVSSTGFVRYSAPVGLHDDLVIALALAAQGLPRTVVTSRPGQVTHRKAGWEYFR